VGLLNLLAKVFSKLGSIAATVSPLTIFQLGPCGEPNARVFVLLDFVNAVTHILCIKYPFYGITKYITA